jgi:lipopolysaccharide transport system ATP-binding protein
MPVIVCQDVVKSFYWYRHRTTSLRELFRRHLRRKPIHVHHPEFSLDGLDLRIEAGEGVVLLGPNGSGKSTVLRLLAGIYQPTAGTIRVRGRVGSVIELGAGFHPELTGEENVRLYAAMLGLGRRDLMGRRGSRGGRFAEILDFAGIGDFITMPVKYWSSGMQARLSFAAAVCLEPDILLLDEVLAVGDQEFRERCLERLRAFKAAGGTMVVVTHDPDGIEELCPRALWLEAGQVQGDGPTAEIAAAYLGRVHGET